MTFVQLGADTRVRLLDASSTAICMVDHGSQRAWTNATTFVAPLHFTAIINAHLRQSPGEYPAQLIGVPIDMAPAAVGSTTTAFAGARDPTDLAQGYQIVLPLILSPL